MKNRILSLLLAMVLLSALVVSASAAHPVPDLSKNGSLTFVMDLDGVLLDNGNVNLYKVGEIAEEDGNYGFVPIEKLQGMEVELDSVGEPYLAEELLTLAQAMALTKITAPIEDGNAAFSDLPIGLYLVWQGSEDATEGLFPIQPFLISVPKFQNGTYELDVLAKPKNAPETIPPETTKPTPPPSDEKLPQTGQLNWPVPAMALAGAVLFITGWILCISRKRMGNEK